MNFNKVIIAGNLTRDPQIRFLANEQAVANFGLAINRRYKGKDGEAKEEATFVDVEAWGKLAELVGQYLTKGSGCLIEGRLKLDTWEDKEGKKQSKLRVVCDSVQFIGGQAKGGEQQEAAPARATKPANAGGGAPDEGPPFMPRGEWE